MRVKVSGVKSIAVTSEFIKLDSLLKLANIASSGGEAKQMILAGDVYLNGEPCLMRGKKIYPGDIVRCLGATIHVSRRGDA